MAPIVSFLTFGFRKSYNHIPLCKILQLNSPLKSRKPMIPRKVIDVETLDEVI